jgi:hypothetical protein
MIYATAIVLFAITFVRHAMALIPNANAFLRFAMPFVSSPSKRIGSWCIGLACARPMANRGNIGTSVGRAARRRHLLAGMGLGSPFACNLGGFHHERIDAQEVVTDL